MEELNKTQLILLAILISFITSIATGIVTVTLLDQAPPAVTQTINRVVKETVKEIVPTTPPPAPPPQTIIIKEEDFIVEATKKTTPNLVEIGYFKKKSGFIASKDEPVTMEMLGSGFVATTDGVVIASPSFNAPDRQFFAKTENGMLYGMKFVSKSDGTGLGFYQIGAQIDAAGKEIAATEEANVSAKFPAVTFANPDALHVGQTAIALASQNGTHLLIGVISRIETVTVPKQGGKPDETEKRVSLVYTTIGYDSTFNGSPLVKSDGQIIGINLLGENGDRYTIPSNILLALIEQVKTGKDVSTAPAPEKGGQTANAIDTTQN